MAETNDTFIVIGKFASPYGVKGWIKIQPQTRPIEAIINYKPWFIENKTGWQEIEVEIRPHGKGFIAHISNIDNPETAHLYTNKTIAIKREQLPSPKKDEYYWSDLEGITVTNLEGTILGKIEYLIETGSNDVMIVIGTKRHLIPFILDEVVIKVDLEKKSMQVDWDAEF